MRTCLVPGGGVPLGDTHTHKSLWLFLLMTLWHHTEVVLTLLHFDWLYIQSHGHSAKALQQTVIQYIRCCTHSNQMQTQIPLTFSAHDTLTSYRGRTVLTLLHFDWLYIQSHGNSAKALQQTVIQYIRCCTHSNQMLTIELLKDKHSRSSETKPR